ncbi:MAG TPA: o-succinylbenzoate synthase [Mycobacteriales bacterium]|nr:o-succinylbenzoate synthase [Mycobacteriales bacterium]
MTVSTYDLAMRIPFRGQQRRQGMLISGPSGWGEFSPFPEYDATESARWLAAALEAANDGWPSPRRSRVAVNTTVPAIAPQQAHDLVAASGCATAKVKVAEPGQSLTDDLARVEAVRDALGSTGRVRVDANAGWTLDEATKALRELSAFDLEYAEQPVASLEDMAALRRRVDVRLAADESIRKADDPERVAVRSAADIVVLKVQPLGGVRACLRIAERCGLPVVVSSAIETSIGIAAGLALAGALDDLPYACGLATVPLLDGDVCSASLVPDRGSLPVLARAPEPDLLGGALAPIEVERHWQQRRRDAQEVLGGR